MAAYTLPVSTWFSNGQVAAAGTMNVYQTLTTTPVIIYSDGGLTVPITNPITLDSNGQAKFYVDGAVALRLDIYSATGALLKSVDPVYPAPALQGFTGTGTDLNKIVGITNGVATVNKALVIDSNSNVSGINTETSATASTKIANMTAVINSMQGGLINRFRNPLMDIWQRGISGTITAGSPAYSVDGWIISSTGANITWAQSSNGNPSRYGLSITGAGGVTNTNVKQRIESFLTASMAGQITFQIIINNATGSSFTPTLSVNSANATDNFAATTSVISAISLQPCPSGTSTVVSYTFASAGTDKGLEFIVDFGSTLNSGGKTITLGSSDARVTLGITSGLNSNPPKLEYSPIALQIPINRRYLPARISASTTDPIGPGMCITTTTAKIVIPFDVPARISPTAISISAAGDFSVRKSDGSLQVCTGLTFVQASQYCVEVLATVGSAVLTAGNATELIFSSATGTLVITGAEL